MKNKFIKVCGIIIIIFTFLFVWEFLGIKYQFKEEKGKYTILIKDKDHTLPIYYLPDEYHFYGRYVVSGQEYKGEMVMDPIIKVYDRMVSKIFFEYKDDRYYVYFSDAINHYEYTYPDVYNDSNDEKVAKLWKNPEGYFISDNYFYYIYGKDYYNRRILSNGFLTGHKLISYGNYKVYNYARLNLDTMENDKISKDDYIDKRKAIS